ncbi:MAG: hypothetical protein ACTS6G_02785 [Candidatus Hodgkinia cicadicola]
MFQRVRALNLLLTIVNTNFKRSVLNPSPDGLYCTKCSLSPRSLPSEANINYVLRGRSLLQLITKLLKAADFDLVNKPKASRHFA